MLSSTRAVWSASSLSDGVLAGRVVNGRTAASQALRRRTGSAIQPAGTPCSAARSSCGMRRRTSIGLVRSLAIRQPRQQHRDRAPAGESAE